MNDSTIHMIQEAIPVEVRKNGKGNVYLSLSYSKAMSVHSTVSIMYVTGERLVNVGGTECMCGGTHVKNTADIRSFTATKIKKVIHRVT